MLSLKTRVEFITSRYNIAHKVDKGQRGIIVGMQDLGYYEVLLDNDKDTKWTNVFVAHEKDLIAIGELTDEQCLTHSLQIVRNLATTEKKFDAWASNAVYYHGLDYSFINHRRV